MTKDSKNAEVIIAQKDDPSSENQVIVDIDIDKKGRKSKYKKSPLQETLQSRLPS